jgi:sodium/bile acid cotransporter 7
MQKQDLGKDIVDATDSIHGRRSGLRNSTSTDESKSSPIPEHEPKPKPKATLKKQNWVWLGLQFIAGQWFLISLGLVILVASQIQVPLQHQRLKSTLVSYLCVSIIFFLTGCTLSTKILIDNFARWKLHLFVQIQVYLVTSAVIFGVVSLCATNTRFMDPGLLLGMLLTGCTPTTIASNVIMTGQAHGNSALTVVESTLSNFLGPFLTPILFKMYISANPWYAHVLPDTQGGYGDIYKRVFKQLGLSLFVPMV